MTRYRSAWSDPEHVRLAAFRSWWDENSSEPQFGPLPPGEDLWSRDPLTALRAKGGLR